MSQMVGSAWNATCNGANSIKNGVIYVATTARQGVANTYNWGARHVSSGAHIGLDGCKKVAAWAGPKLTDAMNFIKASGQTVVNTGSKIVHGTPGFLSAHKAIILTVAVTAIIVALGCRLAMKAGSEAPAAPSAGSTTAPGTTTTKA
jgi:hypothetical protein